MSDPQSTQLPTKVTVNHRADGTFAPGNRASTGGRNAAVRGAAQRAMDQLCAAMTDTAAYRIAMRLVRMAQAGDVQATTLIYNRLCGLPEQKNVDQHLTHHIEEIIVHVRDGEPVPRIFQTNAGSPPALEGSGVGTDGV